ncbi:MAG: NAD(P)-dependent oxidoreductase [Conexivisphaerales archaeon]
MKLGFIGLGTMGMPMVENLLKKGYEVHAYDVVKDRLSAAAEKGARIKKTSQEVAKDCDIVLLSLPKREISLQVCLGSDGILETMKKGGVIVELSTVPPSTVLEISKEAKKSGVEVLDAPVSGGRAGAEKGELTIMVGGNKQTFERCKGIFESIGKRVFYVGELGSAEAIKLLNSLLAISNLLVAREALIIAKNQKLDLQKLHEVVEASTGQSWMWSNWVKGILRGVKTGSTPRIMMKDMSYALEMVENSDMKLGISRRVLEEISSLITERNIDSDAALLFDIVTNP